MPPKIRELIAELERNGFTSGGGKGSHRNYEHILGNQSYSFRQIRRRCAKVSRKNCQRRNQKGEIK